MALVQRHKHEGMVPGSLLLRLMQVNMTEDKEAKAGLGLSSEFHFGQRQQDA